MGCASARKDSNTFKKLLADTKKADQGALIAGLELLACSDLRHSFSVLSTPCLSLFGQFDSLVPVETQQNMQNMAPYTQSTLFRHSSHAPFISETELFCDQVVAFCGG